MIDLAHEKPITLDEAAKTLPGKAARGSVCYHTLYRWATRGMKGLRLETICVGNQRYTSAEAVERFVRSLTAVRADIGTLIIDRRRPIPRGSRGKNKNDWRATLAAEHGISID